MSLHYLLLDHSSLDLQVKKRYPQTREIAELELAILMTKIEA
jgi:hypothetical protein